MRTIPFVILLAFGQAACASDADRQLPEDAVICQETSDCADFTDEGGMCCDNVCVDCWADHDGDGVDDCSDSDYLDDICRDVR